MFVFCHGGDYLRNELMRSLRRPNTQPHRTVIIRMIKIINENHFSNWNALIVHCTSDTIFMYAIYIPKYAYYSYTHIYFFSSLYWNPVVIVRHSESIEGIARLMMPISCTTRPARRRRCAQTVMVTAPGSHATHTNTPTEKSDWEGVRERRRKKICQPNTT